MTGIVRRFIEHGSYMAEQGFIGWPLEGSAELQAARAQLWDCLVAGLKDGGAAGMGLHAVGGRG